MFFRLFELVSAGALVSGRMPSMMLIRILLRSVITALLLVVLKIWIRTVSNTNLKFLIVQVFNIKVHELFFIPMSRNLVISKYCELLLLNRHRLSFFLLLHWFSNHRLLVKSFVHTYIRLLNHCLVKLCQFPWVDHWVSLLPWFWSFVVHFRVDLWLEVFLYFFFFSKAFVLHHFLFCLPSFFDVLTHSIQKFLFLLFAHFLAKIMSFSFNFHNFKFFLKLLQFLFL